MTALRIVQSLLPLVLMIILLAVFLRAAVRRRRDRARRMVNLERRVHDLEETVAALGNGDR